MAIITHHGAELINAKGLPLKPYSHAHVKHRAAVLALDPPSDPQQKRAEDYPARCRAKTIPADKFSKIARLLKSFAFRYPSGPEPYTIAFLKGI